MIATPDAPAGPQGPMKSSSTELIAELERLAWWSRRTFGSDRQELRELMKAWCMVRGVTVRNDLVGALADHVAQQSIA
jgi:hypothetical protein